MSKPNEWVITDSARLRLALGELKSKRKLSLEDLFHKMGGMLLNQFLHGKQDNLRSDTIFKAIEALGVQLVIREPATSKMQQRLEMLRVERRNLVAQALNDEVTQALDRDEQGRLTRALTPQEVAEVEQFLEPYGRL